MLVRSVRLMDMAHDGGVGRHVAVRLVPLGEVVVERRAQPRCHQRGDHDKRAGDAGPPSQQTTGAVPYRRTRAGL